MRITQNMTTNKMLLNINRNARVVDNYYTQMTSGKKIQYASDNPIIASRALKFRTNIAETEQYKRNAQQGISWMEITEQGFVNINTLMKNIRDLCDQGANDTLDVSDRQKIASTIQMLYEQIGGEMNITYAGRYVFSGYRTDEPPVLQESNKSKYIISQEMKTSDVEYTRAYAKVGTGISPEVFDVARLKLPYSNITDLSVKAYTLAADGKTKVYTNYPITTVSLNSGTPTSGGTPQANDNAYTPPPNGIYYVQETGELILGSAIADSINREGSAGIEINYTKEGFQKGELNPRVYFNCTQILDNNGNPLVQQFSNTAAAGSVFMSPSNASYDIVQKLDQNNVGWTIGLNFCNYFTTYPKDFEYTGLDIKTKPGLLSVSSGINNIELTIDGKAYAVTTRTSADSNAYSPPSNGIYYVKDTGELVFGTSFLTGGVSEIKSTADIDVSDGTTTATYTSTQIASEGVIKTPLLNAAAVNLSIEIDGITIVPFSVKSTGNIQDPYAGAYKPSSNEIFYIEDTGELIFGSDYINGKISTSSITLKYNEPGSLPYTDISDPITLQVMDNMKYPPELINIDVTSMTSADNWMSPPANGAYYLTDTGNLILGTNFINTVPSTTTPRLELLSVSYTKTGFKAGDLIPSANFSSGTQTSTANGVPYNKTYSVDNQELQFEFGTNTRITINNLSKDVYSALLYSDLKALTDQILSVKLSTAEEIRAILNGKTPPLSEDEIEEQINQQLTEEKQLYNGVLHDWFNNMLGLVDKHSSQISTEYTKLGSRMNRLNLISSRLEEDVVSYTQLMSDNENVDYLEVIMRLNSAESIYQASLKSGASIMQISLVDFIR